MERRVILDFIHAQIVHPKITETTIIYGEIPNYFVFPFDWKIEVLKILAIGEELYRLDPPPARIKYNQFFLDNKEKIIEEARNLSCQNIQDLENYMIK
jgi:hypothetical protein